MSAKKMKKIKSQKPNFPGFKVINSSSGDVGTIPKPADDERNPSESQNGTTSKTGYTIIVDSEEKRNEIQAALDDIATYCEGQKEEMRKTIAAEVLDNANAERGEIINSAKKEAEEIKEQSKAEIEAMKKEAEAEKESALDEHRKYTLMIAQIEANKADYRHEALNEVDAFIKNLQDEHDALVEENDDLKRKLHDLSNNQKMMESDLRYYIENCGDVSDVNYKLRCLEEEKEMMTKQYENLSNHYQDVKDQLSELQEKLLLLGDDPERTQNELNCLRNRVDSLEKELGKYPSDWESVVLKSSKVDDLRAQLDESRNERNALTDQLFQTELELTELEDYRRFVKILELQRNELKAELDRNIAQYERRNNKVFAGLSEIDEKKYSHHRTVSINLETLCKDFRAYLDARGTDASTNKSSLYYDERTIRTFIAGFASSKTMIFEGLSGTGKTSLPLAFADFMGCRTDVVAVQSSWKDKNDLLGFYNEFKKQYTETDFLKYLYEASCDSTNIHIIVLDEMNLSRVEYYFADILSKLELAEGKRSITLISHASSISGDSESWPRRIIDGELEIPENVWFIGTANKDDSTFTITDKVYDRSVVISFESKGVPAHLKYVGPKTISYESFRKALDDAIWSSNDPSHEQFKQMMNELDSLLKKFEITYGNRIYRQLEKFVPAYIACGGEMKEAIDVMFSLKVIRKLEGLYDDRTKDNLEKLEMELDKMPLSKARVKLLRSRLS